MAELKKIIFFPKFVIVSNFWLKAQSFMSKTTKITSKCVQAFGSYEFFKRPPSTKMFYISQLLLAVKRATTTIFQKYSILSYVWTWTTD